MATMTSEPPDVLPASTFEAHAQEPPDTLPATTFDSAPDTLPASHFDAPDVLPASTFEHSGMAADAGKSFLKGAGEGILKVAQGAEALSRMNPLLNPLGLIPQTRVLTPERTGTAIGGVESALPTQDTKLNTVSRIAGGAVPALAATAIAGPEAALPIFAGTGAASGAASAEDQTAADRSSGRDVSTTDATLRTAGSGLLGGAAGYAGGRLAEVAGGLPNAAARVAGQGVVGAATGVAENTGQNIIQGRPALQGTGQAAATGGAMGAGLGLGSEVHRAFASTPPDQSISPPPDIEPKTQVDTSSTSIPVEKQGSTSGDQAAAPPPVSEPPDTLPPEVFEGKANAAQPATAAIQAERVPATPEAARPIISPSGGMEKPVETAGTAPGTAKSGEVPLVGQAPKELPTSSNLPSGASISEPTPPPVAGQGETPPPDTTGIAHRVSEARGMEANRGEGISTEDSLERGRDLLKQGTDPNQVVQEHASTGKISGDAMAVVRAHGEELAKVTNAAADSKGVNSPEYKAAWQAERDWIAKVKPMQTEWHKIGQAQQGETEIDTGTFHGLQRAHFEQSGKDFTESQANKAKLVAAKVKDASDAAEASRQKLYQAAGVSEPTPQMKSLADRIVAKLDTAAASALARIKARHANTLTSGIDPADLADLSIYGAAKIAKGVTKFADWSAEMVKDTGEWIKPHLQQVFDASDKRLDKHINDTAGESAPAVRGQIKPTADISAHPPGTKMTPDRVQALWQKAKSDYVEKGVTNFDEIVHKLSVDTGLPVNDIRRGLAQPKGVRQITNEMYARQSKARELDANAKRWVQNADTPWPIRALKSVPGELFALKVAGHGTVGMVTHAGNKIFSLDSPLWAKNFAKQFPMMLSRSFHEQSMQDMARDPLYITARRSGLANDATTSRDDYQSGAVAGMFRKLGILGNRGFDALKLFRQGLFNKQWNSLPESLKTPAMAKDISLHINHATGYAENPVGNGPLGKTVSTMVFAPKLEASRWGFLIGDPAVAAKRLANWPNETPEARHSAMTEVKQKAVAAGLYFGALAANQALLSASDSKDKVNFTDPTKSDWLSFKGAGHNVGVVGPMIGAVRFLVQLGLDSAGSKKALKGDSRYEAMGKQTAQYARSKFSPFGSVAADVVTQSDYNGRPMPFSNDPVSKRLQREGLGKIGYGEYAAQTALPIPLESALKEVWSNQGASQGDIQKWLKAITIAGVSGSTGARVSPDYRQGK